MDHVDLSGVRVEFEVHGGGDPVVLVQARPFVTWFRPLLATVGDMSVLWYRRDTTGPGQTIEDDARLCARLLAHVGLERPHLVGHSYGGLVALEVARQAAVDLRSLALLEPAPTGLLGPAQAAAQMEPLLRMARESGAAAAMEHFLRGACGASGRDALARLVPGAVEEALTNARGFFDGELPAAIGWSFTPTDAARVDCRILNLCGALSDARFRAGSATIQSWFPSAEHAVLDGAGHLMMAEQPEAAGALLGRFWNRG